VRCDTPGWTLKGQYEEGKEGTKHFQGMLLTPQVRGSAVKRAYPRAHIEVARNKKALAAYVEKEDTRVASYETTGVPNIFQYQRAVCELWVWTKFEECRNLYPNKPEDEIALIYLDGICAQMIRDGAAGLEFVAINPMWRSSWKKFYHSIITRYASSLTQVQSPQGAQASQGTPDAYNSGEGTDLPSDRDD